MGADEENRKVGNGEKKVGEGDVKVEVGNGVGSAQIGKGLTEGSEGGGDGVKAQTNAAASATQRGRGRDKKQASGFSKFLAIITCRGLFGKFRDCYVTSCMSAAESHDLGGLISGAPGMLHHSESKMIRNAVSQRFNDHDEVLASLSRQVSMSLSRNPSVAGASGLPRNGSTGIGFARNASTGIGLSRNASTGFMRNASTGYGRRYLDSSLYASGRDSFLTTRTPLDNRAVPIANVGLGGGALRPTVPINTSSVPASKPSS